MAEVSATAGKAISRSPEKVQEKHTIIELKNGKVNLKQKLLSLEKLSETLQEIVKFREMIEQRVEKQDPPLESFPNDHLPLIAKLGHESDKSLAALAKHMQQELMPPLEDSEEDSKLSSTKLMLPLRVIELAIKSVLSRNNYGLEALNGSKTPAAVCVWRWEVKEDHKSWLPKTVREKAEARLLERIRAKEHLKQIFEALTQSERDAILDPKGTNRTAAKDTSNKVVEIPLNDKSENRQTSTPSKPTKDQDEGNQNETPTAPGRPKKPKDLEKVAKEKERLEKKAARAEKEKKAKDLENKSRSIMANFFSKPKAPSTSTSKGNESNAGPSRVQTDFEKTFRPFALKRGSTLAPYNWFATSKKRKGKEVASGNDAGVIVVDSDHETEKDGDDIIMYDTPKKPVDVGAMSANERLRNILVSLPPPLDPLRLPRPKQTGPSSQFQIYTPHTVRDTITKLSEAEVAGDDNEVRVFLNQLQNRDLYPAKVFIFHEDARPGYFGTWTRSSKIIGPRKPFAKDVVEFDYGYDSGAEWEEEPMGDADDVLQDDDEDGDSEEEDSDMDTWLVDDDEEPEMLYDDLRDLSPPMLPDLPGLPLPPPPPKRKAVDQDAKQKRRKVVVPLVAFSKGPCWETKVGECEYEPFNHYRIRMFNDTPLSVDPFTFVSTCIEDYKASLRTSEPTTSATANDGFIVPSLPVHVAATSNPLSSATVPTGTVKKPAAPLKNPFPDTHLPFLLNKISEMRMPSFVLLVEAIYQELKVHKVKKIAIEAKIREVGEKCKEKKIWVVKPTLRLEQLMRVL